MDLPNTQKPEGPIKGHDGYHLDVHSIFPTLQGEGPFTGMPAHFLRLAGCNLQCPMCDTDYTSTRTKEHVGDLAEYLIKAPQQLVVITGGEPFRQNLFPLCDQLAAAGKMVQIETNGRLDPTYFNGLSRLRRDGKLHVVISPKTGRISETVVHLAVAFKYVVSYDSQDPGDLLPIHALGHPLGNMAVRVARPPAWWHGPIYVHPADAQDDEINELNLAAAASAVMTFPEQDRRLGLQVHKYVGLE